MLRPVKSIEAADVGARRCAAANGTTEQAVVDAALAAAKTQLDRAVAAGAVTQEQADAIYTHLQQEGARLLSGPGDDIPAQETTFRPRAWRARRRR